MSLEVTYQFEVCARCPVDGSLDVYSASLSIDYQIDVEDILAHAALFEQKSIYQEDLTQELSNHYKAEVSTIGTHSGVTTTVTAVP